MNDENGAVRTVRHDQLASCLRWTEDIEERVVELKRTLELICRASHSLEPISTQPSLLAVAPYRSNSPSPKDDSLFEPRFGSQVEGQRSPEKQRVQSWDELDREMNGEEAVFDQVYIDMIEDSQSPETPGIPTGGSRQSSNCSSDYGIGPAKSERSVFQGALSMSVKGLATGVRTSMSPTRAAHKEMAEWDEKVRAMTKWGQVHRPSRRCPWFAVPIFYPESKIRCTWLFLGFIFIIVEAYLIPLIVAFNIRATVEDEAFFTFISIINAYFIWDVPMNFISGYIDTRGEVVMNPEKIARRYAKSWMVGDIIAAIPWEWILNAKQGSSGSAARVTRGFRFLRAHRLLRLTRLIQLLKLKHIMDRVDSWIEANQGLMFGLGVLTILCLLSVICHWAACLWYVVGSNEKDGLTWLSECTSNDGCRNMGEEYISSLYFTLTTMTTVGFGDITPLNYTEIFFVLVLLLVASIVFAGLMGSLTDLIAALNKRKHLQAQKRTTLARYMHWRGLPPRLMTQVRHYLVFLWETNEDYEIYEEQVKSQLPPVLRMDLCYHIFGAVLTQAPFLVWMKDYPECIKELAQRVKSLFLASGDVLFRRGEVNAEIHVLLEGKLHLSTSNVVGRSQSEATDGSAQLRIPRKQNRNNLQDLVGSPNIKVIKNEVIKKARLGKGHSALGTDLEEASVDLPTQQQGSSASSSDLFRSEVLKTAATALDRRDNRELKAVQLVQRRWRENRRERRSTHAASRRRRSYGARVLEAPAYLGESCLWVDFDGAPSRYRYSARCHTRCEFVHIPQEVVFDVISQFAPWLPDRFTIFRDAVRLQLRHLAAMEAGRGNAQQSSRTSLSVVNQAQVVTTDGTTADISVTSM